MTERDAIRFYALNGEYGRLGNFSRDPFMLHGEVWRTSEHLFQALKHSTVDGAYAGRIRDAKTPRRARDLAWAEGHPPRADWDDVRDDAMRLAVLCKFVGQPELESLLLSTGNREIIEASKEDRYWGEGSDRTGQNMLGRILMEVRDLLRRSGAAHAKMMMLIGQPRDDLRLIR
jgi:N-glycosidase YbiA